MTARRFAIIDALEKVSQRNGNGAAAGSEIERATVPSNRKACRRTVLSADG